MDIILNICERFNFLFFKKVIYIMRTMKIFKMKNVQTVVSLKEQL